MYACAHFRYVTCSVRVCTDVLSWMAGRAGAGRLPSDRRGDGIRGSKVRIQQKVTPLKFCARPSSMEHFKCSVGGRTPSSVPRAAGHPLLATAKMQKKKNGYWCPTYLCFFDQTFQKLRPLSATIQENATFTFLSILEVCFIFCLFFAYFPAFFALIRATLGFFVVFPKKSYTLIRATFSVF